MATVSMLVYLEECVYIYKKVPANKKSLIIWVNGAAPVGIYFAIFASFRVKYTGSCKYTSLPGDRHHVVFGDVDPESDHVY